MVEGDAPARLAGAVAEPFPADAPARVHPPQPLVIARSEPDTHDNPFELLLSRPARPDFSSPPKVYTVQARLAPADFSRLKDQLQGLGEVVFEEAAEPLPDIGAAALTPQAVLWWGQTPSGWTRWARVPIVVDVER